MKRTETPEFCLRLMRARQNKEAKGPSQHPFLKGIRGKSKISLSLQCGPNSQNSLFSMSHTGDVGQTTGTCILGLVTIRV